MRNGGTKERGKRRLIARYRGLILPLFLLFLVPAACQSGPSPVPYSRPYPAMKQSEVLNIQVFRRTKTIEFTNTTARAFGPSTIWINSRFCQPIDGLAIGQSLTLRMKDFRDEFNDAFRGGGFFAVEVPERLALAQIETKDAEGKPAMYGMIVVGGGPDE